MISFLSIRPLVLLFLSVPSLLIGVHTQFRSRDWRKEAFRMIASQILRLSQGKPLAEDLFCFVLFKVPFLTQKEVSSFFQRRRIGRF